jgi:hypothetical protein
MKNLIIYLTFTFIISSCAKNYVQFEKRNNEITTYKKLKEYLHDSISIALRTPGLAKGALESDREKPWYNLIEIEFLKAGITVRDRNLFNDVLNRAGTNSDYADVFKKTQTDFILEITNFSYPKYLTNEYFNDKGIKKIFKNNNKIERNGVQIDFKLVYVPTNQFCGSFTYNYTPCLKEKCEIKIYKNVPYFYVNTNYETKEVFNGVEIDNTSEFIRVSAQLLIKELEQLKR